jgi:hypothetical protein
LAVIFTTSAAAGELGGFGWREVMKKALKQLIDALDEVFAEHEEVGDTAVRQFMFDAVHEAFVVPKVGYELPEKFGMFSEEGDEQVRAALERFLSHQEVIDAAKKLKTSQARLDAFQDGDVESSDGNTYDEYFGYAGAP